MIGLGEDVSQFKAPQRSLGDLDADMAGKLIAAAADLALIIGRDGTIQDIASHDDKLCAIASEHWIGQAWIDTVTIESRPKIEALLRDVAQQPPRSRQVNHPVPGLDDLPILYSAVAVGDTGRTVAVGRDLRPMAALQQRLVNAQQSMEREYSRLRHAETRYRLLFQLASEAVLIADAGTLKVTDANPAASELLGLAQPRIVGRPIADLFERGSTGSVRDLLSRLRAAGRADDVHVRLVENGPDLRLTASLFRQDRSSHVLLRLGPVHVGTGAIIVPKMKSRLISVVENLPDGFVVAGVDRRILTANQAFLDLAQLASEELARGEPLDRWLGRSEVDLNVLVASLREHGSVRRFMTVLRGEYGTEEEVEVSAVSVTGNDQACFGFTVRSAGRRPAVTGMGASEIARSASQFTDLVGRVSLKELVRETTDVVERLCIEAALELTSDNRASAAEMLGLSRQSLYAKLRRYGLGDLDVVDDDDA